MAASAEPPAYSVSYGGFCASSSSFMLPCKMEASISLPPSPSSSHSSLSLEPLSPPATSCCLPEETLSFTHLLSTSYTDIPSLLDTPSSCSSLSHLSKAPSSPSTLRKRPASFLCELEPSAALEDTLMAPKRICASTALDGTIPHRSSGSNSSDGDTGLPNDAHSNEPLDGPIWQNGACAENANASKELDDMLDLLLQEAEVAPILTVQSTSLGCHESSLLAYKIDNCREESKEGLSKLDYIEEEGKELYSKPSRSHQSNHLEGSVRSMRTWSDTLQDGIRGSQKSMGSNGTGTQELQTEVKANAMRCCEELRKQIASTCGYIKQEQIDIKEEKLQEDQSKTNQQVIRPLQGASSRWAGPTLLDIESALAMTSPPSSTSPFGKPPAFTPSSFLCSIRDILQQDPPPPHFLSSFAYREEPTLEEDDKLSTWRRLQKRSHVEPRYTVKIRCEEDAVNDGYRWRKYGQKSIKNSPYPRSYYRCSSGKCNVKKQVERSGEDAGVLLVSYEGIHLHHRPTHTSLPAPSHV